MAHNSPLLSVSVPDSSDPANVPGDLQTAVYGLEEYTVIPCTSVARPGSPHAGMTIFETDTKKIYVYSGAAWLHHNPVVNCTSSTRPNAPYEGQIIYETNTASMLVYKSAQWDSLAPKGYVGSTSLADFNFGTSYGDSTTFSWNQVVNRIYRVTVSTELLNKTATGTVITLAVRTSTNTVVESSVLRWTPAAQNHQFIASGVFVYTAASTGSVTWKLSAISSLSNATQTVQGPQVLIEDIGLSV